ncbi:hypothetical protein Syun_024972 [Stephania yunnanensis]|uniref:Uncharacterized protein n=1 Tax=Stephania yunnanensis TaxID=152371 RepID=A0AAP0ETR8_9MAGN
MNINSALFAAVRTNENGTKDASTNETSRSRDFDASVLSRVSLSFSVSRRDCGPILIGLGFVAFIAVPATFVIDRVLKGLAKIRRMTDQNWSSSSTKPDALGDPHSVDDLLWDSRCTYRMFVEDIAFSNCALNMACEVLQLELGNMNLRLFGSPRKFYGQAQAHETDRLRQVIEKEMLKVEVVLKNISRLFD